MSATGERVSETRLQEIEEAPRTACIMRAEAKALCCAYREILALRQLLRESKPALEFGATSLRGDLANMARIMCGEYERSSAYRLLLKHKDTLSALAHRAGELT